VNKLFEGHTINYIECINVDYKSTRREPFMDVQVRAQGQGIVHVALVCKCIQGSAGTAISSAARLSYCGGRRGADHLVCPCNLPPLLCNTAAAGCQELPGHLRLVRQVLRGAAPCPQHAGNINIHVFDSSWPC